MKYPYPCCRCGFCCLSETCLVGMKVYGIGKSDKCSALSFEDNTATCLLVMSVPIGDGCCIKARAFKDGKEYDFAALPVAFKLGAARSKRIKESSYGASNERCIKQN